MQPSNIISTHAPSAHHIQRGGLGFSRGLDDAELARIAPAIFAPDAHKSRSDRYAYIPTLDLVNGMRQEGFLPVKVSQAKSREEDSAGFGKHLIRFRRHDQLEAAEAREVVLINSHNGSSSFRLMAGVFRLVCSNGLIVGNTDNEIRLQHSGDAVGRVIEGAYSIVKDFDRVSEAIENMKAQTLTPDHQRAFASAALALRFEEPENCGISPEKLLQVRRNEDRAPRLWETFNVLQENVIKGGIRGHRRDANDVARRTRTREVKGIDQNVALNRGLWVLAEEMQRLAA